MAIIIKLNRFLSYFYLLIVLIIAIPSTKLFCQNEAWINSFIIADQESITKINSDIASIDLLIFQNTGIENYDSISNKIENGLIEANFNIELEKRTKKQKELTSIFETYINGTQPFIDSVEYYKSSLESTLKTIDIYKGMLEYASVNGQDVANDAKAYLSKIITYSNITSSQKQFFTLFALDNKSHLITKLGDTPPLVVNTSPTVTQPTSNKKVKYANVIIDEKVVESIQLAIDNYEEDTTSMYYITSYDIENLNKNWDKYVVKNTTLVEEPDLTTQTNTENSPITEPSSLEPVNTESNNSTEANEQLTTNNSENYTETAKVVDNNSTQYQEPDPVSSANNNTRITSNNTSYTQTHTYPSGLVYRVQIAADRVPLSKIKLRRRYKGNREIKMFQEEGWYKYYIAETQTLKEAILIKKESKVFDAFVMAYKNGKKIQYYLEYAEGEAGSVPPDNFIDLKSLSENNLIIVVQIAANSEPLSNERLREIYPGGKPLNYLYEDGWHKYSFGSYKKFWPANIARRKCGVKGAFVVAYKNGLKVDLWGKK